MFIGSAALVDSKDSASLDMLSISILYSHELVQNFGSAFLSGQLGNRQLGFQYPGSECMRQCEQRQEIRKLPSIMSNAPTQPSHISMSSLVSSRETGFGQCDRSPSRVLWNVVHSDASDCNVCIFPPCSLEWITKPASSSSQHRYDVSATAFCAFSCSLICLVQLCASQRPCAGAKRFIQVLLAVVDVLPTWVESTRLGHLVSELALCAQIPDYADRAQNDDAKDSSVALPVCRLTVPATRW